MTVSRLAWTAFVRLCDSGPMPYIFPEPLSKTACRFGGALGRGAGPGAGRGAGSGRGPGLGTSLALGVGPASRAGRVALGSADAFVGSSLHDTPFQAQGAVFVFGLTLDYPQTQQLDAGAGAQDDRLGYALATDGTYAAIGAPWDEAGTVARTGSVQIFVRAQGRWQRSAKLVPSDGRIGDEFGTSVAISGDTLVVGAPFHAVSGAAYVYQRVGPEWIFRQKIVSDDRAGIDDFGATVALEQNRAMISARGNNAAYIFVRDQQSWTQEAKLLLSPIQFRTYTVAIGGSFAFGGNPEFGVGKVHVFRLDAGAWVEQASLQSGSGLDFFSQSMALSGNRLLVGEPSSMAGEGAAYVFERNGFNWTQTARLSPLRPGEAGGMGYSVALYGDR